MEIMKENFTISLHEDLILEILLRLPVSSLLRFKCVCKSWHSLICDSQFAKSHFDLDASPSNRIINSERAYYGFCYSTDLADDSEVCFRVPCSRSTHYGGWIELLGSCRGFVLLLQRCCNTENVIVWNPSTGEHKLVPHCGSKIKVRFLCGFGYDESTDDYLVVILTQSKYTQGQLWITLFSIKTNSWNCMFHVGKQLYAGNFIYSAGLFLNGALHWLVITEEVYVIIAFDLAQKNLWKIPLPFHAFYLEHEIELHDIGGCLGMSCHGVRSELWMLKDYKVLSSWTRVLGGNLKLYYLGHASVIYRESLLSLPNDNRKQDHQP